MGAGKGWPGSDWLQGPLLSLSAHSVHGALVTGLSCPLALGNSSPWALMGSLEGLVGAGCHPIELWLLAQGPAKFCFCLGARSSCGKCVQVRIRLSLSVSFWDALGYQPSSAAESVSNHLPAGPLALSLPG